MAPNFDPYYKWLGIAPEEQPANHYRLLGLRLFESDPEVIESASDQRMAHLRTHQTGPYSALSQKLLNEVAAAKLCLISAEKRAKYNETLRPPTPLVSPGSFQPAAAPLAMPPMMPIPLAPAETAPQNYLASPGYIAPPAPEPPPAAGTRLFDLDQLGVSNDPAPAAEVTIGSTARTAQTESRWHDSPQPANTSEQQKSEQRKDEDREKRKKKSRYSGLVLLLTALALLLGIATAAVYYLKTHRAPQVAAAGQGDNVAAAARNTSTPPPAQAPVLGVPNQGAVLPNSNPPTDVRFNWQPVPNASEYSLEVEKPDGGVKVLHVRDPRKTSVGMKLNQTVPQANCRGWKWRVKAKVDGQWSDWSEKRAFDFADPPAQIAQPQANPPQQAQSDVPQTPAEVEKPDVAPAPAEVQPPPVKPQPIVKQALPSEAARRQASEAMRKVYAKQYAAAKSPDERRTLAGDMLRKADESAGDPATQYALMDRARAIAANGGDLLPALAIADHMTKHFDANAADLKRETLSDCLDAAPAAMLEDPAIGACVLDTMGQLERAEQYDAALKLGNQYSQKVRPTGKPGMLKQVSNELRAIHDAQGEQSSATEARNVLTAHPNDPAASTALGRYRCLFQGDWRGGLPLLAQGNDPELRGLAHSEQQAWDGGLDDNGEMLKLADGWYDRAEKEANRTLKSAMYRRARHWYEASSEGLADNEKTRVKQRIDRIGQAE